MTPGPVAWQQIPLFQGLSEAELDTVAARLVPRSFAAGEVLIHQGIWRGELFILRGGLAQGSLDPGAESVPARDSAGRNLPLRRLVPGECFGEMSLLTGQRPSATVHALTDGTAWVLEQQAFLSLALAQPRLAHNVSAILSERLAHANEQRRAATRELWCRI